MFLNRFKKILKWTLAILLFIIIAAVAFINTDYGQNFIARQITKKLSQTLKAKVSVKHVSFSLLNRMYLEGLYVEDQHKDTLLYAGKAQVRITDWFIFKNKAVLKYAGIENAIVYLNRTDSTWNYKFLQDYFSRGGGKGKKEGIAFDLKILELRNVFVVKKDAWLGQDMIIRLASADLDANNIDFSGKNIDINSLTLTNPFFHLKNYKKLKPSQAGGEPENEEEGTNPVQNIDSLLQWNKDGWIVHLDRLRIENGIFKNQKISESEYFDHFDGRNIEFTSIDGIFKNMHWEKDTITANLDLKTNERSGLEVKSMIADIKFHPHAMEFANMEIHTNKSVLKDFFAMRYNHFSDMDDYIHKIRMESNFTETDIDSDDIAFFAPALKKWKKRITVTGKISGTVDDLFANEIEINAGRNTFLNGNISLSGLPDIYQTFIDFKANDFRTTYADATTFIPSLKKVRTPKLERIQYLHFNGSFTGFIRDFVTFGTINTNLGNVTSDLNMKLPPGKEPFYSGSISTGNFRLGEFINNNSIGSIAFEGKVKGQGLNFNTLNAEIDGRVDRIDYNNYHYENIVAQGILNKKLFNGHFSIMDTNAVMELNGIVDFTEKIPRFDFFAGVKKLNLKPLNLSKDDYAFSGNLDFNFSSDNIDNFLGDAKITDAVLTKDGKDIPFDSLYVNAKYVEGVKHFTAVSNEFDIFVSGEYVLSGLPDAFKLFLNRYYPAYIKEPRQRARNESFTFDINTRYVDEYIHLLDSNITGFNNSHISGRLNMANNQMELNAEIPSFSYKDYDFQNVILNSKGDLQKLEVSTTVDNINIKDSFDIPHTQINLTARNDLSDIRIVTTSNNRNIPAGDLKAQVRTYSDGVGIRFDSSLFIMNGKTWTIERDGELEFRSNTVASGQLTLRESNQEIKLFTQPSEIGNWNDFKIELKNINVGDISPYFLKKNRLEGLVSGNITIEDPNKTFNVVSDLRTDQIRLDDDSIGQVQVFVAYNNKTSELKVNGQTLNPAEKLRFEADLFLKDPAGNKEDVITLNPDNYPIKILERFIGNLFTDLEGYATGQLKIINNTNYVGKVNLRDGGLKVIFTQCFYKIQDTEIDFRPGILDLGTLKLIDTFTRNTATVRGTIKHNAWKDMVFDLSARVDNRPMQLLNTTVRDNTDFYGRAKGIGNMILIGPQNNMIMRIDAEASAQDSSDITILSSDSRESGIADFMVERKYGRELTGEDINENETNISYDIDLTANRMVNMKVVLDELTGDEIRGRGTGNLRISAGTSEPLRIQGRYNIDEGNYNFTFQSFFKKPFVLKEDENNYIEWNGDPYKANIHIDAVYRTQKKVSFSTLLNANISGGNTAGFSEYVFIIARLRGDLFAPRITFQLDFPPDSPPKTDQATVFLINQLQLNENELNKNVAFLVVFNSFAPSAVGSSLNISTGVDLVVSSISGFLSSQINAALNNFLSNKLNIPGLRVDFSGSLYNPNPFGEENTGLGYDRTNLNFSIAKTLFNDRFVITFEGNYDLPFQSTTQFRSDLLKNFTTEWLINESGTVRATFFYKENVDFLTGATTTGNAKSKKFGASIAYRRDANTFWGLFKRKKSPKVQPKPDAIKNEGN